MFCEIVVKQSEYESVNKWNLNSRISKSCSLFYEIKMHKLRNYEMVHLLKRPARFHFNFIAIDTLRFDQWNLQFNQTVILVRMYTIWRHRNIFNLSVMLLPLWSLGIILQLTIDWIPGYHPFKNIRLNSIKKKPKHIQATQFQ